MTGPGVIRGEEAFHTLYDGFNQMAEVLAITLGPTQGSVLSERSMREPELLTDSATIARRIIALPDRRADVGAMLMRNIAWRVHQRVGDGVATSAVLAKTILKEATRYIQAGGNPMVVKRGIEQGMHTAIGDLARQAQTVAGEDDLTHVANTLTAEPAMSLVLGEMFDVLGSTAHISVENYMAPYLERAYYDGGRWSAKLESPYLMTDLAGKRAIQEDCQVVIFHGRLESAADVQPLLVLLGRQKNRTVLLICQSIGGAALSSVVANHHRGAIKAIIVSLKRVGDQALNDFADLSLLTGATVLGPNLGRTLAGLTPQDLGHVRRAEATADSLVISGGSGSAEGRRERVEQLRAILAGMNDTDENRAELRLRISRLTGGVGVLKVGAYTQAERDSLHQKAEKAIRALAVAMEEGIVPGGGVAYVHTAAAVREVAASLEGDQRQGALILARALQSPFLRIVANRGVRNPPTALDEVRRKGPGYVYDALADRVVPISESGLLDPAGVLRVALETATSGAMMALTIAAVVIHRKPQQSFEP